MTGHDHEHQRAADSVHLTAFVLHETWPQIQDDTVIRQLVMLLGKLCETLVGGDPPAAAKWWQLLDDQYTAYTGGAS